MRLGCHGYGLRSEVGEGLAGIFDGHIELGDQHIHRVVFADGTIQYLSGGVLFLRKVCNGFCKGIGFFFRRHLRIGQCILRGLQCVRGILCLRFCFRHGLRCQYPGFPHLRTSPNRISKITSRLGVGSLRVYRRTFKIINDLLLRGLRFPGIIQRIDCII